MPAARSPDVIGWEPISTALAGGLEDLVSYDWGEATEGRDYPPLDISWNEYIGLERLGRYRGVSVRRAGRLIGYNGYDVFKPKRHRSTLWAFGDAMFIDKEHRGGLLAFRLLAKSHELLREIGVQWVVKGDMAVENLATAKPRASFGDLLVKIGYTPFDRTYVLKL